VCDDPHDGLQQSQKRVAKPEVPDVGGMQAVLLDVDDDDEVVELRLDDDGVVLEP